MPRGTEHEPINSLGLAPKAFPHTYEVSCFRKDNGRLVWFMCVEASTPCEAIANACLTPSERGAFIRAIHNAGLDELPELEVSHPSDDMDYFVVRASPC